MELEAAKQRARQEALAEANKESDAEASDEDDESDGGAGVAKGFAFLASDSDSDEDDSDSDSDDSEKNTTNSQKNQTSQNRNDSQSLNQGKIKPPQPPQAHGNAKSTEPKPKTAAASEEELLEAAIAQAQAEAASQAAAAESSGIESNAMTDLFAVRNFRELNPDYELRQKLGKYGAAASSGTAAGEQTGGMRAAASRQGMRGASAKPHKAIFCNMNADEAFVVPTFASAHGGAHMIRIGEDPDGSSVFSFEVSQSYRSAHQEYQVCQSSMDVNRVVAFLQYHPWHVPALLQMYEVYVQMSQLETAEMMLRCALYTLECWLHPRFPELLQEGKCRLRNGDSTDRESANLNATFERALFKSMLLSSRRGCHTSAYSLAKTLYNLDPRADRRFILLALDILALRAGQSDFVLSLFDLSPKCRALPGIWFTRAIALHRTKRSKEAKAAAAEALRQFPGALVEIVTTLRNADPDSSIGSDAMVQSALEKCKAAHFATGATYVEEKLYAFVARMGVELFKSAIGDGNQGSVATWFAFQATNVDLNLPAEELTPEIKQIRAQYAQVRFGEFADEVGAVNVVDNEPANIANAPVQAGFEGGVIADEDEAFGVLEGDLGNWQGDDAAQGEEGFHGQNVDPDGSIWQRLLAAFLPGRQTQQEQQQQEGDASNNDEDVD